MHIESYEVFRAIVDAGSVTKAAKALRMNQSTASRHLQALEDEYGGLLFERRTAGLSLTELGETLYPLACDLLNCHARAKQDVLRKRQEGGSIVVGATRSIGESILPRILGEMRKRQPQTDIRMRVSNTRDVLDDLLHHRIDVALVEGLVAENDGDFQVRVWRDDELVLVCAPCHAFAKYPRISLDDLIGQPLLAREEGSGTRQVTEFALAEAGMLSRLTFAMELGSNQAIKAAIEANLGLAFLSRLTVAEACRHGNLVEVPIDGFRVHRHLYILVRSDRYPNPMIRAFTSILRTHDS